MVWSLSTQSTPEMNSLFSRASLNRSSRTRTRKNSVSVTTSNESLPPRSSSLLSRQKTRPPPLQIIPELSENELGLDVSPTDSPATARPTQFPSQQMQPDPSRITLSAYTFSIDDALLMFGEDTPRSPALSASSSTSDGTSSEDVPATPGFSDDEDVCDSILSMPRLRPQRVSIRPLQIIKTRSIICQDDEDIHQYFEKEEENVVTLPSSEVQREFTAATAVVEEVDQDFYAREFEDFISLSPVVPFHSPPARRDSFTLVVEALPVVVDVPGKRRGRSRHSKPLPLLPPTTPPISTLPSMFPLVQTTAHTSVVRRKRNVLPHSNSSSLLSPDEEARPLPRMSVPLDVEDCIFLEDLDGLSRDSIVSEHPYRLSHAHAPSASIPPAIPEAFSANMHGDKLLPRSSMDSDSSRSSIDSASSFTSSSTSSIPTSPSLPSADCPEFEDARCLRSRWSSSTLASVVADPPRTGTLLSPFRNVLGSRVRRMPVPKVLPQMSLPSKNTKSKQTTPSPPGTPSRLSTSSGRSSSSEDESRTGSPIGIHRKPIPMLMFLRST